MVESMREYWDIPEGPPLPHRFEFCPIWEGPGWTIYAGSTTCAIRAEPDATLTTEFAESLIPAVYYSVGGTRYANRVTTVRFLADRRQDCLEISAFCRPIILREHRHFFAQEIHSATRIPLEDRDQPCVECVFRVDVRGRMALMRCI